MKVLFASHSSGTAGAEQSLVHLVREAFDRGHSGIVALPDDGPLTNLLAPFAASFPVVRSQSRLWMGRRFRFLVGSIRLIQAITDVPRYLRLFRNGNYDVCLINSSVAPAPLLASYVAKIPSLLIVRESLTTNPMLRSALPKKLIRWLLDACSTEAVTISKYVSGQYGYPSTVIYPQVARQFIECSPPAITAVDGGEIRAVMFGTISPEKGQEDAVEAVAMARKSGARVALDIFGHGNETDIIRLRSKISELKMDDVVTLHKSTTDVLSVYGSAHIALVCSRNEAFGKVTAEAVLAGRPVLGYGLGGTTEILDQGGGITTLPDPRALSEAIVDLCKDPDLLLQIGKEAAQTGIRETLATTAAQILDRIEALQGERPASDKV